MWSFRIINRAVHENRVHFPKHMALQGLGKNVGPHFFCRAILEVNVTCVEVILDEKIFFARMCLTREEAETRPFFLRLRELMLS